MTVQKRKLKLADLDAVAAEVKTLRIGYFRAGNWSLPQVCWHLNTIMTYAMSPGPHAAVTADPAMQAKLAHILAEGEVSGVTAPERVVPPEQVADEEVDRFLATLSRFKEFDKPFPPHRMFGEMPRADYLRLHLIHCSHHLGHLVPADS
jgi:hypothetical protein